MQSLIGFVLPVARPKKRQAISKMQITFKSKLSFAKSRHSGARDAVGVNV